MKRNGLKQIGFERLCQGRQAWPGTASLMTEHILNKTVDDAIEIAETTERMIDTGLKPDRVELQPLLFLAKIAQFPARIPCAQLGWQTVRRALSSPERL